MNKPQNPSARHALPEGESQGKAQHYIPKMYLKGFMDSSEKLWVLEKGRKPRPSRPRDEAHREDFYTFSHGGSRDETAERVLNTIESTVSPVLRKIANPHYQMTIQQAGSLYMFVALMFARVPAWRDFLNKCAADTMKQLGMNIAIDSKQFHADYVESQRRAGKQIDVNQSLQEAEKLRSFILSGKYEIEQKSVGFNLGMMLQSMLDLAEQLSSFGFHILLVPSRAASSFCGLPETTAFLTCDNPVFTVRPEADGTAAAGVGFGWSGVEVYMPLNKRCCLRLARGLKPAHAWVSERFMKQINKQIMANATRFVYSSRGEKRLGRLFDEFGCKIKIGENAFIPAATQ
jgi:hypothetical protein